jgi:hypothetical protein
LRKNSGSKHVLKGCGFQPHLKARKINLGGRLSQAFIGIAEAVPYKSLFELYLCRTIRGEVTPRRRCYASPIMEAKSVTPILNVTDIAATFAWFEKWGWKKLWDWGTPPTFGAVGSGKEACIFLCQGAQGGRGRGPNTTTFQQDGDEEADKGVWMSVWVDNVDEMHRHCVAAGLEITFPPTDMPWKVREMHLRHPDGHVFRVGRGIEPKK